MPMKMVAEVERTWLTSRTPCVDSHTSAPFFYVALRLLSRQHLHAHAFDPRHLTPASYH